MPASQYIDSPDVVLIGSGIMSATLGAIIKRLNPSCRIQLYEVTEELAQESSHGWNNAGTGHAGICELSYTPSMEADGTVDVSKAVSVFEEFELSRQFWGYAVREGMLKEPTDFVNPLPHVSFVHGAKQVEFLRARYQGMQAHHFFESMQYSEDREQIRKWAPLLIEGRDDTPVAATWMANGTDVNFGAIAKGLTEWIGEQEGCGVATGCPVTNLSQQSDGWVVTTKSAVDGKVRKVETPYVFIGAGGASLSLLQKSGISEAKGYGGFPVGGQWLVCDKPEIVQHHKAKVYGQAQAEAPTMAVPHLDHRIIDGKEALLFGPFAAWTSKFLQERGSIMDLPGSIRPSNLFTLIKTGLCNLSLVRYLVQEGLQTKASRVELLRGFYPDARDEDWRVQTAGIRVQAIKDTAGIVHYGTEVITDKKKSLSALLGASPGASVSVAVMLDVLKVAMPELLEANQACLKELVPSFEVDLKTAEQSDLYHSLSQRASESLQLL